MPVRKVNWNHDQIREWYENDELTTVQIAERLGCAAGSVIYQLHKIGVAMRPKAALPKERNNKWKGGLITLNNGYVGVRLPSHPNADGKGYVRQHRLVMEQHLGRLLLPNEVVHHRNGIVTDNRIENLELFQSHAEHIAETTRGRVRVYKSEESRRRSMDCLKLGPAAYHEQALARKASRSAREPDVPPSPETPAHPTTQPDTVPPDLSETAYSPAQDTPADHPTTG